MLSPVLKILSHSNKNYLSEPANKNIANQSTSNAPHIETEASAIKSIQHQLEAITPVNASSLYWLI